MKAYVALLAVIAAAASPLLAEGAVPSSTETAAARQLYALLLTPGPAWKQGLPFAKQGLEAHFYYWKDLFKKGRIATAGPLGSDGGLVLLFAEDLGEAEAIMRSDPAFKSGVFLGSARRYEPPMINADSLGSQRSDAKGASLSPDARSLRRPQALVP